MELVLNLKMSVNKVNICTITRLVLLETSQLQGNEYTTENLAKASPKLVQKDVHTYAVYLWNKECASLDIPTSYALAKISKLEEVTFKM